MRLAGKVAFISGSTRGIGRTMAEMFAAEGAQVVVTGRSVDKGEKVATRIRDAGGDATFVRLDVSDEASVPGGRRRRDRPLRPVDHPDQQRRAHRPRRARGSSPCTS